MLAEVLEDPGYKTSERRCWRLFRTAGIRSVISKCKYAPACPTVHNDLVKWNLATEQPTQL